MKLRHIAIFALWAMLTTPVAAQDFETGLTAARAGDFTTALDNWRPLADQGDAKAQYNLGFMYVRGQGVPQDAAEAVRWYRLAADQGDATAQYSLGFMYQNGEGVGQDIVLAHMWFNIASANGDEDAARNRALAVDKMTREQIADAQARASACMLSGYQDCE